jgi:hypothetical protein
VSRVGVRSEALRAAAAVADRAADEVRGAAGELLAVWARCRPPPVARADAGQLLAGWVRLHGAVWAASGAGGLAGEALALEACAVRLGLAARAYEGVEAGVAAVMASVGRAADVAGRAGWLTEGGVAGVRVVATPWTAREFGDIGDLVAAGEGLGGGKVRVVEVAVGAGSAWVVVVPGTQRWSPEPGSNPFDLTTDVRAVAQSDGAVSIAAAGVAAALERARSASGRSGADDPVLLVGHSQGGILAAALTSEPSFLCRHHVTHVVTTGAPVGLFPVPDTVRVLSFEHVDDPVPTLDLTPNPARASWVTVREGSGLPLHGRRHALAAYVDTARAATDPAGIALPGVAGWRAGAGAFLGRAVRSVTEVVVTRRVDPAAARGFA